MRYWIFVLLLFGSACAQSDKNAEEFPSILIASPPKGPWVKREGTGPFPKYGPSVSPLSKKTNLEYFKKNSAYDFWSLIPFYIPQTTGRECSTANLVWTLNAARSNQALTSDEPLLSIRKFNEDLNDPAYTKTVQGNGMFDRSNVTNRKMAHYLNYFAKKLEMGKAQAKDHVVNLKDSKKSRSEFLKVLKENENNPHDYIIISLIQGVLTGDPEGGPHVVTVAAFDEKKNLVLLLDPDRDWYEPYWVPFEKVFEAMFDKRSDGYAPGWVHFYVQ